MAERKNDLDAFEQHVRGTLEQFEVPYNSADWVQLERALNGGSRGWWLSGAGLATLLISGTLLVGAAAYVLATNSRQANGPAIAAVTDTSTDKVNTSPANTTSGTSTNAVSSLGGNNGQDNGSAGTPGGNSPSDPNDGRLGGGIYAAGTSAPATTEEHARTSTARPTTAATAANANLVDKTRNTDPSTAKTATQRAAAAAATSPKAEPTFHASISEGCPGAPVEFKVEHMPEDGIYLWNFGDGSFSNKANPEHTFTKPGQYQVMLSMSATGVGTIHNKPSSDMIVIHEAPKASFNVLKQEYDGHIPSVHFENRTMGGTTYDWSFGDGTNSAIAHPDHIYKKKGIYQVELTVTNEIGCVDKTLREVRIEKDYNLDAPATFSPDGDGKDETFIPEALRQLGVKFHLAVYDTNGGLLYETTDATKPWTGRLNNRGDVLAAGEYVWVVDVTENLHLAETYTGKVKLTR